MHVSVEEYEALRAQIEELKKASSNTQETIEQMKEQIRQQSANEPSQRFGVDDSFLASRSTTNLESDVDSPNITEVQQMEPQVVMIGELNLNQAMNV